MNNTTPQRWYVDAKEMLRELRMEFEEYSIRKTKTDEILVKYDNNWAKLKLSANQEERDLIFDKEYLEKKLKGKIYDLWYLTKSCQFQDVQPEELVSTVPIIEKRYLKYISHHKNESLENITFKNIETNIELIESNYAIGAVVVLQKSIVFHDEKFFWDDNYVTKEINSILKMQAKKAMQNWYIENKEKMIWWNDKSQYYSQYYIDTYFGFESKNCFPAEINRLFE